MIHEDTLVLPRKSDQILGHPKGLYVCFFTEMWERFSFYGMKYLLLLYLTKYHLFTDSEGLDVLGSYAGLVYAMPVIGGLLADRYLGMRKSVVFGGLLLCLGHLGMAWEGHAAYLEDGKLVQDTQALSVFYFSLALIIVGVGYLKPNISTVVGRLYEPGDPRRDAGFTIFYMGINIGAFTATLLCGWLGETYGWSYGFGAAGIGMLIGLITFLYGQDTLQGHAEPSDPELLRKPIAPFLNRERLIYLLSIGALFIVWIMMKHIHWVEYSLNGLAGIALVGIIAFILFRCEPQERKNMTVLMILILFSVVFWALFEQSSASMTLFADRVVDREMFGITFTASQFGSLNAFFIFTTAPLFSILWVWLGKRGKEPSIPLKFALGIIQVGIGFGALVLGAQVAAAGGDVGKVAAIWLILAYFFHTTGELCLSPIGLSAVTQLSVPRVVGLMMGTWFLGTAYAEFVAAQLSKLASIDIAPDASFDLAAAVNIYGDFFTSMLYIGVGAGAILLLISPWLTRAIKNRADAFK
ncbi:peptide MFS transporter [Gilvimarinus sp. F26214L]|uniref:peptide MFS transporter n=1 Tax=Gilvimarinus sp. DZF01 TaxID=3461371 RepID=UPI0040464945